MDRDEAAQPRRRFRLPLVIGLGSAIAIAGWSVVWATARGHILTEIDAHLGRLAADGVVVACPDRTIGGYPFRMELSCRSPEVEVRDRGVSIATAGLRVVAQVWDPRLVLLEVDGPAAISDTNGGATVVWRDLRASLRWGASGIGRVSIAAEGLDATLRPTDRPAVRVVAARAEGHGRPSGAGERDLDVAASFVAATSTIADKRLGPTNADLSLSATLVDFLPGGPGPALPAFAARGGRIAPAKLSLAAGGVVVDGEGALVLDGSGVLDGTITLVARGLESLAKGGAKELGPELTTVLTGFVLLGKAPKDPAKPGRRLEMIVDHGSVRIGRVTLGRLAPLFAPGG